MKTIRKIILKRLTNVENGFITKKERKIKRAVMWLTVASISWIVPLTHDYTYRMVFEARALSVVGESERPENSGDTLPVGTDTGHDGVTNRAEGEDLVSKIAKSFPEDPLTAIAVAKCESSLDPERIGDTDFIKPSVGLFQINQYYHHYSTEYLKDPDNNIEIARKIYDESGKNFGQWSCFRFSFYKRYL